jgi:hypothetical protein
MSFVGARDFSRAQGCLVKANLNIHVKNQSLIIYKAREATIFLKKSENKRI